MSLESDEKKGPGAAKVKDEDGDRDMRFVNNFQVDECTVPEGMTLAEWRRANARPPATGLRARLRRLGRRHGRSEGPSRDAGH